MRELLLIVSGQPHDDLFYISLGRVVSAPLQEALHGTQGELGTQVHRGNAAATEGIAVALHVPHMYKSRQGYAVWQY